uniref:Uncharacterized protein n=1 Tax=Aegilops tauschii subsp. strangulata TaxID=200361 RepID=A0A453MT95_AEGTS
TGQGEMKWILMMMWKFMPRKIRNERRIKKRSIKGATMTPQILKGMRRMNRGNLEGIAVIARNLGRYNIWYPFVQIKVLRIWLADCLQHLVNSSLLRAKFSAPKFAICVSELRMLLPLCRDV